MASTGKLVAVGPRFSFADWGLTSALVDIDAARLSRARTGGFTSEQDEDATNAVRVPFSFPKCDPNPAGVERAPWETGAHM